MQQAVLKRDGHVVVIACEMIKADGGIAVAGQAVLDGFVLRPARSRIGQGLGRDQVLMLFHPWHMGVAKYR